MSTGDVWDCSRGEFDTNSCPEKKEGKAQNHFRGSRDSEKKEDEEGKLKGERSRSTYLVFWSLGSALNQTESRRKE